MHAPPSSLTWTEPCWTPWTTCGRAATSLWEARAFQKKQEVCRFVGNGIETLIAGRAPGHGPGPMRQDRVLQALLLAKTLISQASTVFRKSGGIAEDGTPAGIVSNKNDENMKKLLGAVGVRRLWEVPASPPPDEVRILMRLAGADTAHAVGVPGGHRYRQAPGCPASAAPGASGKTAPKGRDIFCPHPPGSGGLCKINAPNKQPPQKPAGAPSIAEAAPVLCLSPCRVKRGKSGSRGEVPGRVWGGAPTFLPSSSPRRPPVLPPVPVTPDTGPWLRRCRGGGHRP